MANEFVHGLVRSFTVEHAHHQTGYDSSNPAQERRERLMKELEGDGGERQHQNRADHGDGENKRSGVAGHQKPQRKRLAVRRIVPDVRVGERRVAPGSQA
jgi:hypothetical protein